MFYTVCFYQTIHATSSVATCTNPFVLQRPSLVYNSEVFLDLLVTWQEAAFSSVTVSLWSGGSRPSCYDADSTSSAPQISTLCHSCGCPYIFLSPFFNVLLPGSCWSATTSLSRLLCLMVWLKYLIFLVICFRSTDFVLICSRTQLLVLCSLHDTQSRCL